jgi:putative ABC transport system permease protein
MGAQPLVTALMTLSSIADVVFITRESGVIRAVAKHRDKGSSSPIAVVSVRGIGSRVFAPLEEDSVALSEATLRSLGLVIGQSVELELGGTTKILKVARLASASEAAFSRAAVVSSEHFHDRGIVDEVLISAREEVSLPEAILDLELWMRSSLRDARVIVEPISAPIERAQAVTAAYRFNIFIVAAMSLCVCALLVYQATQLSLLALSREVSILSVLGLSGWELSSALVLEAAIISTVGAILGLVIGYPLTLLVTNSLLETAYDLYGVEFSLLSKSEYLLRALVTIVTVTAVGSVSAAAASLRAITGSASQSIRRERVHVRPISRRLVLVSTTTTSVLLAGSLLWLYVSPNVFLAYVAVVVSLVWVAATALAALTLMPYLLSKVTSSISRILATAVLKRSGGSYAFGVMAAAVAITLMTSLGCMVGSFRGTLRDWSRIRLQGDIFISSAISGEGNESRIPQEVVDTMRSDPEIHRVVAYRETRDSLEGKDIIVAGTDVRAQCERGVYIFVAGSCEQTLQDTSPSVLISESAARKCALSKGDTIILQERRLKVAGVLREFGTEQPLFVTSEPVFNALYNSPGVKTVTIDLRDASRVEALRESLQRRYPGPLVIRNHRELLDLVDGIFNRTFTVTDSVRWIVFILALAGLVSGYLQHAWERRVDLSVLDVQGLNHWEWTRVFCAEALSIVIVSAGIGGIGGGILGYVLTEYVNPLVFGWQLGFTVSMGVFVELLGFILVSVLSMLVGGMFVLQRVRRNVGLRDE